MQKFPAMKTAIFAVVKVSAENVRNAGILGEVVGPAYAFESSAWRVAADHEQLGRGAHTVKEIRV